jgi:hypothetical protein
VPTVTYFDPARQQTVSRSPIADSDVEDMIDVITDLRSGRGHPAAVFTQVDGSSLSVGTDGRRAFLLWTNSIGESFASVGSGEGPPMVYDYFGSWSEARCDALVSLVDAIESVRTFVRSGVPDTEAVIFSPG